GEEVDAVGLFKSESKETFLKVYPTTDNFEIESEDGININKLDKGCLVFNTEKENGYLVSVVDNLRQSGEAMYWRDNFLNISQRRDNFHQTEQCLDMCKQFVTERLPENFNVNKVDQADMLNKSIQFFKENDAFTLDAFTTQVMQQPEVIQSFKDYKDEYEADRNVTIDQEFDISDPAVKKQAKVYKSVIKLDKNFHIYVHGNRQLIEKGYDDERDMQFYKIFYKTES
ncbi:MAG: nucleoid-associated protein, partial [Bacteroidales bacterium]|nr:nucleoid-associated protein [Bacteroidales bacterium]